MKKTMRTIKCVVTLMAALGVLGPVMASALPGPPDLQPVTLNTLSQLDQSGALYRLSDWPSSAPLPPDMLLEPGFVGDGDVLYYSPSTHSLFLDDGASVSAQMPSRSMAMNDLTPPPPGDDGTNDVGGGTGSGTGAWATFSYPEGLYFQFIGMTNDPVLGEMAAVGLSGTTNDSNFGSGAGYYLIMSRQDLLATNWWFEGSVQDSNSVGSVSTFVTMSGRDNLFLWARAMTNGEDQLVLPLDWQLQNFGRTGVDPNADADGDEISNLQAYLYGISPNVIQFKLSFPNNYVNADYANGTVLVTAGQPAEMAVVVGTNAAVWQAFCSQISVPLGNVDGRIAISVGLRGGGSGSRETWRSTAVWRDTVPVQLVLTNPVALNGSRPYIDPAGYTTKALRSLTFQVTNPDSTTSGGNGSVVDRECKPGDAGHTTNWFVCFDAALKLGTNYISIAATDLAGFVAVTNFSYVFDTNGDTQAPSMSLTWPQDGATVLGNMFTLRGMLDDDTATVTAQWTGLDGLVNSVDGQVERGGGYWLDLPLYSGTNLAVTVTSTDAAGNSSTTNLTLFQSDTVFTMDSLSNQLNQAQVNLSGSVSDTTCEVWINGVQGVNNGDGTWSATGIPVTTGGVATFDVVLYPSGQARANRAGRASNFQRANDSETEPDGSLQTSISFDKPPVIYVEKQSWTEFVDDETVDGSISQLGTNTWTWMRGVGSTNVTSFVKIWHPPFDRTNTYVSEYTWPADAGYVPSLAGEERDYVNGALYSDTAYLPSPYFISAADSGTTLSVDEDWTITWSMTGDAVLKLSTGGKACRGSTALLVVNQSLDSVDMADGGEEEAIPSEQVSLGVYGNEDATGQLYLRAANGVTMDISPGAVVAWNYALCGAAVKLTPRIMMGTNNIAGSSATVFAGQQVHLTGQLSGGQTATNCQWAVPGYAISNYWVSPDANTGMVITNFPTTNADVFFYWVDDGIKKVQFSVFTGSATNSATATFNVIRPASSLITVTGTVGLDTNYFQGFALHYGNRSPGTPGIHFGGTVLVTNTQPSAPQYTLEWVQKVNFSYGTLQVNAGTWLVAAATNVLDTLYPYPSKNNGELTEDSPGQPLNPNDYLAVNITNAFTMWLLATPDGGIPIPLRSVDWSWSGAGILTTNGSWQLASATNRGFPPGLPTIAYPQWGNNLTNVNQYHPQP